MRELLFYGEPGGRSLKRFRLRQGLEPVLDGRAREGYITAGGSTNYEAMLRLSPSQTKAVSIIGTSGSPGSFWTCPDVSNPGTTVIPLATFAGSLNACDCSDTHYAVGGTAPYLYVFDWATHSLQTVSTAGLGTVSSLAFSPDGSKLAVTHTTSPNLRVYNTADWSYVNAPVAAGASRAGACFSGDGSIIVVNGASSPYLSIFDSALTVRLFNSTSSMFGATAWGGIQRHPAKPNTFICRAGHNSGTTYKKLYEFNATTNTATNIIDESTTVPVYSAAFDLLNKKLYVQHGAWNNRYISTFDATTYALEAEQSLYLTLLAQGAATALAVIDRDTYQLTGTVRDESNLPVAREVWAYERSSGLAIAKTVSNAVTGNYALILPENMVVDVQFRSLDGELLNDLFFSRATPQAV